MRHTPKASVPAAIEIRKRLSVALGSYDWQAVQWHMRELEGIGTIIPPNVAAMVASRAAVSMRAHQATSIVRKVQQEGMRASREMLSAILMGAARAESGVTVRALARPLASVTAEVG